MTEDIGIQGRTTWVRATPAVLEAVRAAGLDDVGRLGSPDAGRAITTSRSSWVRLVRIGPIEFYTKTYDYPTPTDRRRGIGRTTAIADSRAACEWDALTWLRERGFEAPEPLLVGELRGRFFLRRAVLVTEAWPGKSLETVLPTLPAAEGERLLDAVYAQVGEWHAAGFRDRNLDPRNILVRPDGQRWVVAKVDSPRYRLCRPGVRDDRLARADWARLHRGIAALRRGSSA